MPRATSFGYRGTGSDHAMSSSRSARARTQAMSATPPTWSRWSGPPATRHQVRPTSGARTPLRCRMRFRRRRCPTQARGIARLAGKRAHKGCACQESIWRGVDSPGRITSERSRRSWRGTHDRFPSPCRRSDSWWRRSWRWRSSRSAARAAPVPRPRLRLRLRAQGAEQASPSSRHRISSSISPGARRSVIRPIAPNSPSEPTPPTRGRRRRHGDRLHNRGRQRHRRHPRPKCR